MYFSTTRDRIICSFISVFLFAIILLMGDLPFESQYNAYVFYAWFAIAIYAWVFFSSKLCVKRWTIYHLLVLLTFMFYFGGQFLVLIGGYDLLNEQLFSIVDSRIPLEPKIRAMNFTLSNILLINAGYCFFKRDILNIQIDEKCNTTIKYNKATVLNFAWILLFIVFIPTFISLGRSAFLNMTLGHLKYRAEKETETGIWFICSFLSGWFLPACYLLLIFAKYKIEKYIAYISILIYCVLYLLSGSRYQIIEIMFCVCTIHYMWEKRTINNKVLIKLCIGAVFLAIVLKVLGYVRGSGTSISNISFSDAFVYVIKHNIVYEILLTTSITFISICNTMYLCPQMVPYNNCKGYLGALLYMFPSFLRGDFIDGLNTHVSSIFSPLYYGWTISGYGSSFLTEMYYNLGYFAFCVSPFIGLFLSSIETRLDKKIRENDGVGFFAIIYLFSELIWAIRSDIYLIPRHMLLYVLIPYCFCILLSNKKRNLV